MKSFLAVLLVCISVYMGAITGHKVHEDKTCDMSISPEVATNAILKELHKVEREKKIISFLGYGSGFEERACEKFWHEILCLDPKQTSKEYIFPHIQRIIRDSILQIGSSRFYNVLKFIHMASHHTSHETLLEESLEFLLHEVNSYPHTLVYGQSVLFEIGYAIKEHLGVESELFQQLPKAVQAVVSGEPIRLRNNATNDYLIFNEAQTELVGNSTMSHTFNAVAELSTASNNLNGYSNGPRRSDLKSSKTAWTFKMEHKEPKTYNDGFFYYEIKATAGDCQTETCATNQLLTVKTLRPRYGHHEFGGSMHNSQPLMTMITTTSNKFSVNLESDNTISIQMINGGNGWNDHGGFGGECGNGCLLNELPNGKVGVVGRHYAGFGKMVANVDQPEQAKHKWIVEV